METKEVMNVELDEVVMVAEQITPKYNKGLKAVGSAAAVLGVGYALYKGTKWVRNKLKLKKEQEEIDRDCEPEDEVNG